MEKNNSVMEWDFDIPILNNRFIMRGVGIALGIPFFIIISIITFFYIKDMNSGMIMPESDFTWIPKALLIILAVFGLTALFILVVYKNRIRSHFRLDEQGAHFFTRKEDKRKNTAVNLTVFILSIISNRPGSASVASTAQMTQDCSLKWKNVDKFKVYDSSKAIFLRAGFGNKIMIYCYKEDYGNVKNFIEARVKVNLK